MSPEKEGKVPDTGAPFCTAVNVSWLFSGTMFQEGEAACPLAESSMRGAIRLAQRIIFFFRRNAILGAQILGGTSMRLKIESLSMTRCLRAPPIWTARRAIKL